MHQIIDFFKGLFKTDQWPARWHCGYWSSFHGWLYIISDLLIWGSYFLIPLIIINYTSKKKLNIKFRKVYFLFAAFILLCGCTHFIDAMVFWIPMYRLDALVRFATALVSLLTVYYLIKILPDAFKQKTSLELEKEILRRESAEKKLEESNTSLKAFAYIASHDLQEPLRKIKVFSTMLYDLNKEKLDDKSKNINEKIINASGRMQSMINDVLSFSTLNEKMAMTQVNLLEVIYGAEEDLALKIAEKRAVFEIGNMPVVKGNPAYLGQLFFNLFNNALKFNNNKPFISVKAETTENAFIIYVSDNGIGIDENDTTKIFEPFQRLHGKSEYEGSGIGLSICKKIVDIHHGKIRVESKSGEGVVFIIELPL